MKTIKDSDILLERVHADRPLWVLCSGRHVGRTSFTNIHKLFDSQLIKFPTEKEESDFANVRRELEELNENKQMEK